jgi:hypothetical protein
MKLYKYVIPERIEVVRDLRIRFTPPGYLNDPFESRITFDLTSDESETLSNRGHGEFDHDESVRLWRRMASFEWGILCLTKRPDNLVMWAHYAGAHRGFLLEFDSENPFFNHRYVLHLDWTWMDEMPLECPGFGNLRDVRYSQCRSSTCNLNEIPTDSFFVKSTDWEYEEEVRMILPLADANHTIKEDAVHLFRFPPEALTGVVLGAGAGQELTDEFSMLIKDEKLHHVRLRKAKLSLSSFGIEFTEM